MPLEIKLVTHKRQCEKHAATEWRILNSRQPLDTAWELYKGPSEQEYVERIWKQHVDFQHPDLVSLVNTSTGKIVGTANWPIYEGNVFDEIVTHLRAMPQLWVQIRNDLSATSGVWPKGSSIRHLAQEMERADTIARIKHYNCPHVFGAAVVVAPEHKEEGVRMLLEYGIALADDRDLECFLPGDEEYRHEYEKAGFVQIDEFTVDPHHDCPTKEWCKLRDKLFPQPWRKYIMWRPKKSDIEKGATEYRLKPGALVLG